MFTSQISRCLFGALSLTVFTSAAAQLPAQDSPPEAKASLGMNLAGPADYATELPFVDAFRTSREWISQKEGEGWGKGPELALDEHGWVTKLDPGCFAETLVLTISGGHYPSGNYVVLYEGEGAISFNGPGSVLEEIPGRIVLSVENPDSGIFIRITETNPENYIRNIRVIMPGFEETYTENPFHPVFLARWKGMSVLRFMDWMHTNNSKQEKWEDRPQLTDATWSKDGGIPLEVMIDLSNRMDIDPWFCFPHLADDDYIRNFAQMTKETLDPDRKIYLEYSNEMWNGQFEQTQWAQKVKVKELSLGAPERPWEGGCMFYAQRSIEIFKIWEEVFGGTDRLVRVLAWQAASAPYWTDGLLLSNTGGSADLDALAIAPYVSMNVPGSSDNPDRLTADVVAAWPVDQVLDHVQNVALPETIEHIRTQKGVADKYGVKLICYEAGQHLVGVQGGENNEQLTALLHEANAHPRMGEIYTQYYDAWAEAGGDVMAVFSSISRWSKWGSWGLAQYYDVQPSESPKYQATLDWAEKNGQSVTKVLPLE